jgi:8-oxo-dGTP pyrophosphatase MutT (NUDIX family)
MSAPREIDKLAWLTYSDRRVLGVRSKGKAVFYLPGGKREPGESDRDALLREIREELSVDLDGESLRLVGTFVGAADGKTDGTRVRLTCYEASHRGELEIAAEIEALDWISCADAPRCSEAMRIVLARLHELGRID